MENAIASTNPLRYTKMAEKKYISVNPIGNESTEQVKFTNKDNEFHGTLMSKNPNTNETKDVRDIFVGDVRVDGKNITPTAEGGRRVVDLTQNVELFPIEIDPREPAFGEWEVVPKFDAYGHELWMSLRNDGRWEVKFEDGSPDGRSVTQPKGSKTSINLQWYDDEIDKVATGLDEIVAERTDENLLGYRLGPEGGLNEDRIVAPAGRAHDEPLFVSWKNGKNVAAGRRAMVESSESGALAFGYEAAAIGDNAVELGTGTNDTPNSLAYKGHIVVAEDGDGNCKIPNERLVVDDAPVNGSERPVSSGGVYSEVERIDSTISTLSEHVDDEIARLDSTISNLREYTENRFDQVDSTISQFKDDVEDKFNQVDSTISNLQEHVDDEVERLDGDLQELREYTDGRFDQVDSTISQLREYVDEEDEATREEMREGFNQVDSTISNLSEHVEEKFGEIDDQFAEVDSTLSSIQSLIPDQAYEDGNELADKNFVNSSIQTNTASFKGTYNNHEDLGLPNTATHEQIAEKLQEAIDAKHLTYDDNDYAFVEIPHDDSEPTVFERIERYKCVKTSEEGVEPATFKWEYEWTLNNSSFTSDQWTAINSKITSGLVKKIGIEATKLFPVTGGNATFISGDCAIYNNPGGIQDTKWIRQGSNPGTYVYAGTEETPYKWFFSTYSYTLVYNKTTGEVTNGGSTVLGRIPKKPGTDEYPDPASDDLGTFTYTPPSASPITFTFKSTIPAKVDSIVKESELIVELAKKLDDKANVIESTHLSDECVSRDKLSNSAFDQVPTDGSNNLLSSGVVKTALDSIETKLGDYVKTEDLVDGLQVDEISANDITIDGKKPSLEGHTHVVADITDFPNQIVNSVNGDSGEVTLTGEDIAVSSTDQTTIDAAIGTLPRVWSDDSSTPNRFVDGNRQLGYAARTWVRSDTGAVYAYKGYDVQTRLHSWYADADTKLTYSATTGEIASNGYLIATVETGLDPWRNRFAPINVREGLTFTYTDDASFFINGKFAFLTDIPSVPVRSVNTKIGEVTLTGADITVSGTDQTKIDAALEGKKDDFTVGTGLVETSNKLYAYRGVDGTSTERELRYTVGPADVGSTVYSWNGSATIPTGETVRMVNTTIGRIYTVSFPNSVYYDRSSADDIVRPSVIAIDQTVVAKKTDIPAPSNSNPQMDGIAASGASAAYARGDHVHPTDTSRVPTSRTVNGKALTGDVMLTANDIDYSVPGGAQSVQLALQGIEAALAGKASKSDVDLLLFAQYYPDGNVKSAAEFTSGIKYDEPDTTNRTITVKPFCNTGTAENDNSSLVGCVVIPPFVDGDDNGYISDDGTRYKVVGVESGSDSNNSNENLTAVIAPSTVTNIGDKAFRRCTKLKSASIPAATSIGSGAFNTCASLASVSLPAATRIGTYAFNACTKLVSVSLPAVTRIDSWAFYNCTSLASVSLPVVTRVDGHVFDGCIKLVSVSLPVATTIGGCAFYNCTSLASVSLPAAFSVDGYAFYNCTSLESVDFGATLSSVSTLGSNAFNNVPKSCKIIVPDSQYDAWIAAENWSTLYADGYKFLKHSEWEYARKYELDGKLDKSGGEMNGTLAVKVPDESGLPVFEINPGDPQQPVWPVMKFGDSGGVVHLHWRIAGTSDGHYNVVMEAGNELGETRQISLPLTAGTIALTAGTGHNGNLAKLDENGNPTDSNIPSANMGFNDNKQSMRIGMSTKIADGKTRQLALGDYSETNANGAIAIGVRKYSGNTPTKATADNSIAIGQGAQATAEGATQIGFSSIANNKSNSLRFMDTEIVDGNGKIPSENLDVEVVTKEELEDGITTDEIETDSITIDGKQCATKDLVGQEFNFATTQGFMNAIAACVRALGGTVINNPSEQNQGGN